MSVARCSSHTCFQPNGLTGPWLRLDACFMELSRRSSKQLRISSSVRVDSQTSLSYSPSPHWDGQSPAVSGVACTLGWKRTTVAIAVACQPKAPKAQRPTARRTYGVHKIKSAKYIVFWTCRRST